MGQHAILSASASKRWMNCTPSALLEKQFADEESIYAAEGTAAHMVIAGTINRVAFYCRVNHRDRDYEKYLDDVMRRLEEEYGKQKWDLQIFFEEASGADPNRKEFNRLKAEIAAKKIDVVVTMRAATIARNWGQFMEFMLICNKRSVEVVCIDKVEDAQAIFQRIQEFKKRFFEGSDVTCE